MDENTVRAIIAKVLEERGMLTPKEIHDISHQAAQHGVIATFRLFGIKMTEDGLEQARKDFTFMNQLRMGSQFTRAVVFKTSIAAISLAMLTLLGRALWHELTGQPGG